MTTDIALRELLLTADTSDIDILVDHLTDNGKGRLAQTSSTRNTLVSAKVKGFYTPSDITLIVEEFQRFGGNTVANLFRLGNGVPHSEILMDVAKKMNVSFVGKPSDEQLESALLERVMEECLKKSSEDDLLTIFKELGGIPSHVTGPITMAAVQTLIKSTGFLPYKYAAIVANAVSKSLLGHGLNFAATGSMMKGISAFAGPIGWGLTAIWTAYDLGSPAYRITIPCVIQIAYMRQKHKYEASQQVKQIVTPVPAQPNVQQPAALGTTIQKTLVCQKCKTSAYSGKFCMECGTPLTKLL